MIKQRGYTLVELAIVLVVSTMITTWLVISYLQVQRESRNAEAERDIAAIKEAIISYAADHRAGRHIFINGNPGTRLTINWELPANRPYLPCPDITGDGREDRRPAVAVTLTIVLTNDGSDELESGDCYRNKGLVPWRTLGVRRTDPWGNYYTYRVDYNFSHSAIGFDEFTRADSGRYTRPLQLTMPAQRLTFDPDDPDQRAVARPLPADGPVATIWAAPPQSDRAPSIICDRAPCFADAPASVTIIAGVIASTITPVNTGGYASERANPLDIETVYAADYIISGVPVVILSHGQNGNGAVRADHHEEFAINCRPMPDGNLHEAQNAFWRDAGNLAGNGCANLALANSAVMASLATDDNTGQYGFVARPRSLARGGDIQGFDDIVGWMSTKELIDASRERGILPVGLLPPVGLEDDPGTP